MDPVLHQRISSNCRQPCVNAQTHDVRWANRMFAVALRDLQFCVPSTVFWHTLKTVFGRYALRWLRICPTLMLHSPQFLVRHVDPERLHHTSTVTLFKHLTSCLIDTQRFISPRRVDINMDDRHHEVLAVAVGFLVLTWSTVSMRCYVRGVMTNTWGLDDFCMIASVVSSLCLFCYPRC